MSKLAGDAFHYKDEVKTGCKLWSNCTTCPYIQCQEDLVKAEIRKPSRIEIIQHLNDGLAPKEVAYKLGISIATLYRKLHGNGQAGSCSPRTIVFRLIRENGNLIVENGAEYFGKDSSVFEVVGRVRHRIPIDRIEE